MWHAQRFAVQVLMQRAAVATEKVRMAEEKAEQLRESVLQAENEAYAPELADFARTSMKNTIEGCLNQARSRDERCGPLGVVRPHRTAAATVLATAPRKAPPGPAPAPARSSSCRIRTCGCGSRIR
jgi:hypothetical protein